MERFGIHFNRFTNREITQKIRCGKTWSCDSKSHRLKNHLLWVDNTLVKVGYDKSRGNVVTFLYPTDEEIELGVKLFKEGRLQ